MTVSRTIVDSVLEPSAVPTTRSADVAQSAIVDSRVASLARLLERAAINVDRSVAARSTIAERVRGLRQRLEQGRLQLAVLGQFKRGKSAFINALLGAPALPSGVIPLTAVSTFIAWGPRPSLRVTYHAKPAADVTVAADPEDICRKLFGYVAEEANPGNRLGVARVDLAYPAPILASGVTLIDTPGIGSTLQHNTDAALAILPECDAALFVVSPDPPITEAEIGYLELIRTKVARLFFVLNKSDCLQNDELETAAAFLRKTVQLGSRGNADAPIFRVSGLGGLKAKASGDPAALERSGVADIEAHLLRYLATEKLASLSDAVTRKAADLLAEAAGDVAIRIRAFELPFEDLQKRAAALQEALDRITVEERAIADLLASDRRRAVEELEAHAERLRKRGRERVNDVIERTLTRPDPEHAVQSAIALAISDFFEDELAGTARSFGETVDATFAAHQRRINELVNFVRRTAADLFDASFAGAAESEPFRLGKEPYWVTEQFANTLIPTPAGLAERLLPARTRRRQLRVRLQEGAAELVRQNVENLRWTTLQALNATFRRFTAIFEDRLAEAMAATRGAVAAATDRRMEASNAVDAELIRLRRAAAALRAAGAELMEASAGALS